MEWIKIFKGEEEARSRLLPGQPQLVIIGKRRISIVLFKDRFFAVRDACPHNGESLSKGKVNYRGELICPWHGYVFDLETGRECSSRCGELNTYAVKMDETGFYVGIH